MTQRSRFFDRHRLCLRVTGIALLASPATADPPPRKPWVPIGRLDTQRIPESSGIVKSRRYPDIYWTHNDSGNAAVLFAIRLNGEIVAEVPVPGANNSDWEDIALDDAGNLYVGDIGNNRNIYPQRFVYVVREPDPFVSPVKPATLVKTISYTFPKERFDAESLLVSGDQLYIISKVAKDTTLYHLQEKNAGVFEPQPVCTLPVSLATGADLSEDGLFLAVCSPGDLTVFETGAVLKISSDKPIRRVTYPHGNVEACCFDKQDVIMTSEDGKVMRITASELAGGIRFESLLDNPCSYPEQLPRAAYTILHL